MVCVHACKMTLAIITVIRLLRFLHEARADCSDGFVTETAAPVGGGEEVQFYCNVADCNCVIVPPCPQHAVLRCMFLAHTCISSYYLNLAQLITF
jgi:hypothetical protein